MTEVIQELKEVITWKNYAFQNNRNTYLFIYFEQYLVRDAQFSEAGLNGALMKKKQNKKKNTKNNNR